MATYAEYTDLIDKFAEHVAREGTYRVLDFSVGEIRMWRFMNQQLFTLVRIQDGGPNSIPAIDITGGGACGLRPSSELFRYLATPDEKFQFGWRFASIRKDGMALSGARLALPLAVLNYSDPECTRFIVAMIENLGLYSRQTAEEIIPSCGGRLLNGFDEDDVADFFGASTGNLFQRARCSAPFYAPPA
jgi:hypothetical protein